MKNSPRPLNELTYFITYLDDEGDRTCAFPQCWMDLDIAKDWRSEVDGECPGRDTRVECLQYPIGATIWFGDCTATVPISEMGGALVLARGVVVGLPTITGDKVFITVCAHSQLQVGGPFRLKRMLIYAGNIVEVEPPNIKPFEDGIFGGEPLG